MESLFRDNIWEFIGVVISIIAVLVPAIQYYKLKNRKSVAYKILLDTEMFTTSMPITDKLQIFYDGVQVENLRLLVIRLINDGDISIEPSDFRENLTFQFNGDTKIISAKIIDVAPNNLKPVLVEKPQQVCVDPILLNRQDTFTVAFLISQFNGKVELVARIVGIPKIQEVKKSEFFIILLPILCTAVSFVTIFLGSSELYLLFSIPILLSAYIISISLYRKEKKLREVISRKINDDKSTK